MNVCSARDRASDCNCKDYFYVSAEKFQIICAHCYCYLECKSMLKPPSFHSLYFIPSPITGFSSSSWEKISKADCRFKILNPRRDLNVQCFFFFFLREKPILVYANKYLNWQHFNFPVSASKISLKIFVFQFVEGRNSLH